MTANFAAASAARPGNTRAWAATRRGVLAMLPLLAAFIPFALVIGSVIANHGDALAGWSGSWVIYGGSAHLAAIRTLDRAGPAVAILTGLLVNARLLVYSTALARRWSGQPRWFRIAAAALIIDPTWALADQDADQRTDLREQRRFFVAAALTLGVAWSGAMAVGVVMGARLDAVDLNIVIPLCLLGLVGKDLRAPGARSVIVVAALVALLTANLPAGSGLLVAVAAGCVAGVVHERRSAS